MVSVLDFGCAEETGAIYVIVISVLVLYCIVLYIFQDPL